MAEEGKTMSEIVDVCQTVRGQLRTIGLSASGIRVPGQPQLFEVRFSPDEIQLEVSLRMVAAGRRNGVGHGHSW